MSHILDKDTVKRILHLSQVQGLEAKVIAERFGFSSSRVYNVLKRQAASVKQQANHSITVTGSHSTSNKHLTK